MRKRVRPQMPRPQKQPKDSPKAKILFDAHEREEI